MVSNVVKNQIITLSTFGEIFLDIVDDTIRAFIEAQHIFFTGSAAPTGRVNVSPKGMDAFRVLGPNKVAYLDVTGTERLHVLTPAKTRAKLVTRIQN